MKKYLLDTNVLIFLVKNEKFGEYFDRVYAEDPDNFLGYSYISLGELNSITLQNKWGIRKIKELNRVLKGFNLTPTTGWNILRRYGEIDAFSQGKLVGKPLPSGMSARNMGKNDLWISATASVLEATLITTDRDFLHLHEIFLTVDWVDVQAYL